MISWLAARFLGLPDWAVKVIEIGVLLAALGGAIAYAHHHVYQQGRADEKAERKADDDAAMRIASAQAYTDQKALSDKFLLAQRDRFKENHDAKATIDYWRGRVQSGATVLRIPTSSICPVAEGRDPTVAGGSGGSAGSILVPASADDILGVAGAIAAGVRRQNALIATYNEARATCNKH